MEATVIQKGSVDVSSDTTTTMQSTTSTNRTLTTKAPSTAQDNIKTIRAPTNRTGLNHFERFKQASSSPNRIQAHEDIVQEMLDFWEYLQYNSDVNSAETLSTYMTNVKMWHLYEHECRNDRTRFRKWPTQKGNDELSKRLRDSEKFFQEFGVHKGEGRIPLTPALAEMIREHIPGSKHMKDEIFDCLIHTQQTGNRLGEIVAKKKTTPTSNLMTVGHVKMHRNIIDFSTKPKAMTPRKRELTFVGRREISEMSKRYGSHWDFFKSTKKRIAGKQESDPLYTDDHGRPLTYQDVYRALRTACAALKLPEGTVGGHSGRIYLACYLSYRGATVAEIMKRGRWKSDAWLVYVKLLVKHAKDKGADQYAFKIGDLGILLNNFPNHPEFARD